MRRATCSVSETAKRVGRCDTWMLSEQKVHLKGQASSVITWAVRLPSGELPARVKIPNRARTEKASYGEGSCAASMRSPCTGTSTASSAVRPTMLPTPLVAPSWAATSASASRTSSTGVGPNPGVATSPTAHNSRSRRGDPSPATTKSTTGRARPSRMTSTVLLQDRSAVRVACR